MQPVHAPDPGLSHPPRWPAALAWALGWAALLGLDGRIDLANQALLMVLTATVAAVWSGPWSSLVANAAAVLAFNFLFVPPRGAFAVGLHQHLVLLATMLAVSWIVALLMARLRWHAARAMAHAQQSDRLRRFGEHLRAADSALSQAAALQAVLSHEGDVGDQGGRVSVLLGTRTSADVGEHLVGEASPDEAAGLRLCARESRALGPGTGRHEEQPAWYLPLRGRQGCHGAALMRLAAPAPSPELLEHAQALCDQLGAALEHTEAMAAAAAAREQAQAQALRNTLLTAISHDHRTPLATILGAASALHDQGERLSPAQRNRLASTIVDEATQLARLTDNTLQLARLGSAGLALQRDWESVEELVGTAVRHARQRHAGLQIKARVEPGLPLLRCDALLMVQLLDNLVDNAVKHGSADEVIEVLARRIGEQVLIAVRDRGPGVPLALRERIFETFQRGEASSAGGSGDKPRTGAGIGLALCRAIAMAHGGELRLRPRSHGGSSFELRLPVEDAPPSQAGAEAGA